MNTYSVNNLIINLFILILIVFPGCSSENQRIQDAVKTQLELYPESSLQDIYKSFFQDEFGPGHLLNDTAAAIIYFLHELNQMESKVNYTPEPCGVGENFYRVPLDLAKDSIIPVNDFVRAFLESGKSFKAGGVSRWKKKWGRIITVIDGMDLNLDNYESDKKAISEMFEKGEFVMHHSLNYQKKYQPHYRIMRKEEMEKLLENSGVKLLVPKLKL